MHDFLFRGLGLPLFRIKSRKDIKTIQLMCTAFPTPDAFLATILNGVGLNPDSRNPNVIEPPGKCKLTYFGPNLNFRGCLIR